MFLNEPFFSVLPEIEEALHKFQPVVALESTVITHGLPYPQNLELARSMEAEIRMQGAIPATIALLDGRIHIGLTDDQIVALVHSTNPRKVSYRDVATAILKKENGGTTVAGTLYAADAAGIRTFATGGIGGVHRNSAFDISTDLSALAQSQVVVVCAGAKAILDLPATLEVLESNGVPVIGYQTDEFPAFYSAESGLPVSARLDSPQEVVEFALTHWKLGFRSAILVAQPPPAASALPSENIQTAIAQATREADEQGIHGQDVTPFLLKRLGVLTDGATLKTNLALLLNNAHLAAAIARAFASQL